MLSPRQWRTKSVQLYTPMMLNRYGGQVTDLNPRYAHVGAEPGILNTNIWVGWDSCVLNIYFLKTQVKHAQFETISRSGCVCLFLVMDLPPPQRTTHVRACVHLCRHRHVRELAGAP